MTEARRQLHKNVESNIEQVLAATTHLPPITKTIQVRRNRHAGFELVSPCPFPTTIIITPRVIFNKKCVMVSLFLYYDIKQKYFLNILKLNSCNISRMSLRRNICFRKLEISIREEIFLKIQFKKFNF